MLRTQEGLEYEARESKVKEIHQKALALLNLHLPTSTPNLVRGSSRRPLGDLWAVFPGQKIEKADV